MSLNSVEQFTCPEAYPFTAIHFSHKVNLKYANNTDGLNKNTFQYLYFRITLFKI